MCSYLAVYSHQMTTASDWPFLLSTQLCVFVQRIIIYLSSVLFSGSVFASSSSEIHHHKRHQDNMDYFQQLAAPQYIFSIQFHLYCKCVCILQSQLQSEVNRNIHNTYTYIQLIVQLHYGMLGFFGRGIPTFSSTPTVDMLGC